MQGSPGVSISFFYQFVFECLFVVHYPAYGCKNFVAYLWRNTCRMDRVHALFSTIAAYCLRLCLGFE